MSTVLNPRSLRVHPPHPLRGRYPPQVLRELHASPRPRTRSRLSRRVSMSVSRSCFLRNVGKRFRFSYHAVRADDDVCSIGAQVLSHYCDLFPQVSSWLLFIIGGLNIVAVSRAARVGSPDGYDKSSSASTDVRRVSSSARRPRSAGSSSRGRTSRPCEWGRLSSHRLSSHHLHPGGVVRVFALLPYHHRLTRGIGPRKPAWPPQHGTWSQRNAKLPKLPTPTPPPRG